MTQPVQPAATERIATLIDRALDWTVGNLDRFDPYFDGPLPDLARVRATIMLGHVCLARVNGSPGLADPRVAACLDLLRDVWSRPEYLDLLRSRPGTLPVFATHYMLLRRCGVVDQAAFGVIQQVVDEGYALAIETEASDRLGLRYVLDLGGFDHPLPGYEELYEQTLLARCPSILHLTDDDVYRITHTVLYLSDYGTRRLRGVPDDDLPRIRWIVGSLLGLALRASHWDLVSELLLCLRSLAWRPAVVFEAAWDGLLAGQLPDGAVPGPGSPCGAASSMTPRSSSTDCSPARCRSPSTRTTSTITPTAMANFRSSIQLCERSFIAGSP